MLRRVCICGAVYAGVLFWRTQLDDVSFGFLHMRHICGMCFFKKTFRREHNAQYACVVLSAAFFDIYVSDGDDDSQRYFNTDAAHGICGVCIYGFSRVFYGESNGKAQALP